MGENLRDKSSAMLPFIGLNSNHSLFEHVPEDFTQILFFWSDQRLLCREELSDHINIHDADVNLIEHVADQNVNSRVKLLVRVESISLLFLILRELVIEGGTKRTVWQFNHIVSVFSEEFRIVGHFLLRLEDPSVV